MISVRRAAERGVTDWGWLDSRHTFSFGDYYDPEAMGFRSLRVINDDKVAPGGGFGTHPHRDMEIMTWILDGALEHRDSMGNGSVIKTGQFQFMRAGTGVQHSEFNHSKTEPVHLLQIWIVPEKRGLEPAYDERTPDAAALAKDFVVLAAKDGAHGAVSIAQDATVSVTRLKAGDTRRYALDADRHAWLHVAKGKVTVNGRSLEDGDAAAIAGEPIEIAGDADAELLLFDLG